MEWNLSVRDDADGTMTRLQQVTPTTVPLLRAFANEVVLDVLFYEQATLTLTAHRSPLTFHPNPHPSPNPNPQP